MVKLVDKVDKGGGNTNSPQSQHRKWCFTLNNYQVDTVDKLYRDLREGSLKGVVGQEVGDSGTPHLQGFLSFKNGKTLNGVRNLFGGAKPHLETTKGSDKSNFDYCTKQGKYTAWGDWPEPLEDPLAGLTLYPWQNEIIELVKTKPDARKIHWYWEPEGCRGKTTLAKHLAIEQKALIVSGKANDVKYAIAIFEKKPRIVIYCIPRSKEEFVSYDALECVKDGLFFNGKYESGMVVMNCPHVIVFANFEPRRDKLSEDRWVVKNINS